MNQRPSSFLSWSFYSSSKTSGRPVSIALRDTPRGKSVLPLKSTQQNDLIHYTRESRAAPFWCSPVLSLMSEPFHLSRKVCLRNAATQIENCLGFWTTSAQIYTAVSSMYGPTTSGYPPQHLRGVHGLYAWMALLRCYSINSLRDVILVVTVTPPPRSYRLVS